MTAQSVEAFRSALDAHNLAIVDGLRALIANSNPALQETIKWNAPSFALDGVDRITLGIERKAGVRVVLHRGAALKPVDQFHFDDSARLARWAAPDRGVIVFKDPAEVSAKSAALSDLFTRWLAVSD